MADGPLDLTDGACFLRLIEASSDLLLVCELDGTIRHLSLGWERVLGWKPPEMLGRRAIDFVHPDDVAGALDAAETLRQGAPVLRFVHRCAERGGGWRRLEWCAVVSAQDGLIHASVQDVTEAERGATHGAEIEAISGVGSWEVDLGRGTCFWSPVTRAIHEIDPVAPPPVEEGLSFYPPDARAVLEPALARQMAHGTPYDLELPFVTARGRRRWVRTTGAAEVRDGKVVRVYGTFEDITDRREERARLADFADMVDLAYDGIWVIDAAGRISYANPRMAEMLGLAVADILGRPFTDFLDVAWRRTAGTLFAERALSAAARHDVCLRRADGTALWVSMSARPRLDAAGRMVSAIAMLCDITERVAAEDALREREATYAALVALSPIGIALNDMQTGAVLDLNPALLAPTGYTREEFVALHPWDVTAQDGTDPQSRALAQLRTQGRFGPFEKDHVRKDGTRYPVRLRGVRVTRRDGRDLAWSLIEDISEERAQRETLERLGEVARETRNLVVISDREARIEWVNPAFEARTGWRLDEVRGRRPGEFLDAEGTDPDTVARILRAKRSGEPITTEILSRSRSGETFWLKLEIQPRFDAQGHHVGCISVETEITEFVAAREAAAAASAAAERAQAQLIAAVDGLNDGFVCYDAEDRLVMANRRYRELYAASAPAIVEGARFEDILRYGLAHGQYAEAIGREEAWLQDRLAAHRSQRPCQQTLSDGTVLRIVERGTADGGRVGLRVDVTELHRAQEQARGAEAEAARTRQQLVDAVEALDDGFLLFDAAGRLVLANGRYREMYPLTAPAVVPGATFAQILRHAVAAGEIVERQGRDPEVWMADMLARHRQADRATVETLADGRMVQSRDTRTREGGRVGLRVDITEITRAREAAEVASRAKTEFLASMSHEIRTPLNGVLGMADLLANTPLSADQGAMLETIRTSGWSLLALLNDILDLARVEAGRMMLDPRPFDLGAMIDQLGALHGTNARTRGVDFVVHHDHAIGPGRTGDETRLRQILHNLLGNAVKFTEHGSVTLAVLGDGDDRLLFRIRDTGIGMSQEQVARVFGAFEQAEVGTARRFGGTGLGMTIVRKLVDMMDGTIRIDSTPARGTVVEVRLPLPAADLHRHAAAPTHANEAEEPGAGIARLRGCRVLVADDNATNRTVLKALLQQLGVEARFAADGAEAVERWRAEDFDLVLLDISMPVMDGLEALRTMQQEAARLGTAPPRAVAATANVMTHHIAAYLAAGFIDTLPKPVRRQHLVAVLCRAVAR